MIFNVDVWLLFVDVQPNIHSEILKQKIPAPKIQSGDEEEFAIISGMYRLFLFIEECVNDRENQQR